MRKTEKIYIWIAFCNLHPPQWPLFSPLIYFLINYRYITRCTRSTNRCIFSKPAPLIIIILLVGTLFAKLKLEIAHCRTLINWKRFFRIYQIWNLVLFSVSYVDFCNLAVVLLVVFLLKIILAFYQRKVWCYRLMVVISIVCTRIYIMFKHEAIRLQSSI